MTDWLVPLLDAVIVLMVLEIVGFGWLYKRFGRGIPPQEIRLHLLSGLALMAALRASLADTHQGLIVLLLMIAGLLHALDIRNRWRR
ncbi:MAG: hypothetical protein FGM18_06500 [Burkholderiaceae bacterium]|nr:hypothetical protein [Burkholderiaceae bacterium]